MTQIIKASITLTLTLMLLLNSTLVQELGTSLFVDIPILIVVSSFFTIIVHTCVEIVFIEIKKNS